ncbi:MAG TPA: glycosyl transferase [Advenella kashmirensis]|uniref:Glycosyl transferase n=1 Tax=Advenella kashmirensis TaxID=310575 RepID=A0A356LE73_9BURK|nr:glycosyl transferase [Advenella kashmirensis]
MSIQPARRFNKLHEKILLSSLFSFFLGWLIIVAAPFVAHVGLRGFEFIDRGQYNAFILINVSFIICFLWNNRFAGRYPGSRPIFLLGPQILTVYILGILSTFLLQGQASRIIIITSGIAAFLWLHIEYILTYKYRITKLAILDQPTTRELLKLPDVDARAVTIGTFSGTRYDAVVADFKTITPDQQRFLTKCTLERIPVYNAEQVFESITGRVRIRHMSENNIGSLLPSRTYEQLKIIFDLLVILISLPIWLPVVLITAALVKLESPGPAFYTQVRIGQGNKPFTIYKIRSMRFDIAAPERFAGEDDPRITRIGAVIRKLRIDELPQFLNILKLQMSLIGPRPEQPSFVEQFNEKIPFYSYRHVVKPGITGWAQVRYGYAANTDETQIKIEHDFYYIKHCSLIFDFYIALLTLRTMITGFGAR